EKSHAVKHYYLGNGFKIAAESTPLGKEFRVFILGRLVSPCVRRKSRHSDIGWQCRHPAAAAGCDQQEIGFWNSFCIGDSGTRNIHVGARQKHDLLARRLSPWRQPAAEGICGVEFVSRDLCQLPQRKFGSNTEVVTRPTLLGVPNGKAVQAI